MFGKLHVVAGAGVPMKVDTGLFSILPANSDPSGCPPEENRHGVSRIAIEKNDTRDFHTAKCAMGFCG